MTPARYRLIVAAMVGLLISACTAPPSIESTSAPTGAPAAEAVPTPGTTQPPEKTGATPSGSATSGVATSGPLIQAMLGNLSKTLHPYPDSASYTQAWIDAAGLIWGGADGGGALLAFDWEALDYRPAMAAEQPRVSPDGKTFTFTLRDDLKWSDGAPVTVDDFQFAFDHASREDNRYVQVELLQDIASLRSPDQRTIEIALKEARPRDVALGIVNLVTPVPKHVWDGRSWIDTSSNPEILKPSVVLGPFGVSEFKPGERAVFTPIDTYYGGKARVPRVELLGNQQPAAAYDLLKTGRANWVRSLSPASYQDAKADPNLDVKEWTAANATYRTLEFNTARPFLGDRRVRQALAHAVSRSELLDIAEQGLAVPQYSFIQPSNSRWVNSSVARYDLDLARSRQLLQEAGYRLPNNQLMGKDGQAVKLQIVYPTSSGPRGKIAAYLQDKYKPLGIEIEAKGLEFNAYTEQVLNRRDFDISLASYGGGSLDPDLGPKPQLITNGPQNVTGYSNPQVDELFKQGAVERDPAKRKQLYDQIQVLVNQDTPSHYLYALKSVDVLSKKVHGVTTRKGDRLEYNDALLSWFVDQ